VLEAAVAAKVTGWNSPSGVFEDVESLEVVGQTDQCIRRASIGRLRNYLPLRSGRSSTQSAVIVRHDGKCRP
jgi:hypothetical protein